MEDYRPILFSVSQYVAWWTVAALSSAHYPESMVSLIELIVACAWLLFTGFTFHQDKRYFATLFTWSLALAPWAFYAEYWYISTHTTGLRAETVQANLEHAFVVYNAFKYFLMAMVFIVISKDFIKNIKHY